MNNARNRTGASHSVALLSAAVFITIGAAVAQDGAPAFHTDRMPAMTVRLTGSPDHPNGAWCWYQDERAIVDLHHPNGPMILVGSVSFGEKESTERGDIDLLWWNPGTNVHGAVELHDQLEPDDHNVPSLLVRDDGHYVAAYTRHSSDKLFRTRVSTNPHDPRSWQDESVLAAGANVCYSNLFARTDAEGETEYINASRSVGFDPNLYRSTDGGVSWSYYGRLLTGPGGNEATGQRPYLKYAQGDDGVIHFTATDGHPRNEDNGIYHGTLRGETLYSSDGSVVAEFRGEVTSDASATDFTTIMAAGSTFAGVPMHRAWTMDLHVDAEGRPWTMFTARARDDDTDHRFFYARWTGTEWKVREIAKAGGYLYKRENDYTGLAALDPDDPSRVFISSRIDPRNDGELEHYEIFMGTTSDDGDHWAWTPVTWKSTMDNLRPIVPKWDEAHLALLWLRGSIQTYRDWDAQVLGVSARADIAQTVLGVAGESTVVRPAVAPDDD